MKSKSLKIAIAFCSFFLSINISLAFDDLTTHPALTDEIVDFHNLFSANKITPEEKELIISGAMGEDIPPRWINHFYDPIRNIGWTGRNTGVWPTSLVRYFSGTILSSAYPVSSLNWLHNQELQTYYKMYKGNRTWERAVYEYANGNPQEALYTLGYILHLIEDAAVPDHTRDDPHAHDMRLATGDYGSPLEEYAKRYNRNNFNIADELKNNGYKPIVLSSVDDHLVSLAKYSNGYFFSKDTINDPVYQNPKIVKEDGKFGYGKDKDGEEFELVKIKSEIDKNYTLKKEYLLETDKDIEILSQYFTRLSREAIVHGAGVIDLFFKEAEAVILGQKEAPKLFAEENKSVIQRIIALDAGLGNISATGEFFKIVNFTASAYNKTKETVADVATNVVNLFSQKSNDELSAALEAVNLNNSGKNANSNSNASDTSSNISYEIYQENITPINSSQPATLTVNKIKQAEESLQVLQNQLLALQNQPPSRQPLDGEVSSESNSMSRRNLDIEQPRFAAIIPGFGGGGTGVASASSADSSSSRLASSVGSSSSASESSSSSSASSSSSESSSSSSTASSSSSSSAPDTTPPTLSSLAISECQNSLSSDGCLVATTTLNIAWNSLSEDLDYFTINNNGFVSTTTATSTIVIVSDNAVFSFAVSAKDLAGNFSATSAQTAEISTMPVVINEVAWAGNSATYYNDEWIELYNRTSQSVNLNRFILYSKTDLGPYLNLSGTIAPRSYYLIERTTDDNTVSDIVADLTASFGSGLSNNGENIALVYKPASQATTTIDEIPYDTNWYAGSNVNYATMERYDADAAGTSSLNWGTNNAVIKNGKNAGGGSINGTPKARNSVNYLINKGQNVSSNLTLYASSSPYLVNNTVQVFNASSTLTIEPGVVIKFYNDAGWSFNNGAKISAVGSSAEPIIFTSLYDDTYGGDTNGDATSTSPSAGNWHGVRINSPGAESTISDAIFRYGGRYYNGRWSDSRANLYIANSSAAISDSVFEYSNVYGLKMIYSDSSIADSIFRNNNNIPDTTGYDSSLLAIGGSPSLSRNSFVSNHKGAYFFNSPAAVDSNMFTSNAGEAIYSYGQLGSYSNNSGTNNYVNGIVMYGNLTSANSTATLGVNSLPYVIKTYDAAVVASSTLVIPSGVVLKADKKLNVNGNLSLTGSNASDVILTSLYDDTVAGDTTNDGNSTGQAGQGGWINISSAGSFTGSGFTARYGGSRAYGGNNSAWLSFDGSSGSVSNAVFDNNYPHGIYAASSPGLIISNSSFANHAFIGDWGAKAALVANTSSVTLSTVSFTGNILGILSNTSAFIANAVTFTDNIATTSPGGLW